MRKIIFFLISFFLLLWLVPNDSWQVSSATFTLTTDKGCGINAQFNEGNVIMFSIIRTGSVNHDTDYFDFFVRNPGSTEYKYINKYIHLDVNAVQTEKYALPLDIKVIGKGDAKVHANVSGVWQEVTCDYYVIPYLKYGMTLSNSTGGTTPFRVGDNIKVWVKATHPAETVELWIGGSKKNTWNNAQAGNDLIYYYTADSAGTKVVKVKVFFNQASYETTSNLDVLATSPPTVTTLPATEIESTTTLLNGSVNPNGLDTTYYFASCDSSSSLSYFTTSAKQNLGKTQPSTKVKYHLTQLRPGTTYKYKLIASNSAGEKSGACISFTTWQPPSTPPPAKPIANTKPATTITSTSALLNAEVNPNGVETSVTFTSCDAMIDPGYFPETSPPQKINGAVLQGIVRGLTGLKPSTTYRYAVKAISSKGATLGSCVTFKTLASTGPTPPPATSPPSGTAPTVSTLAATAITSTSATLQVSVNPGGLATTVYFTACAIPTDPGFFPNTPTKDAGGGTTTKTVTYNLTGLNPNTVYKYQAWGKNSKGTKSGACVSFATPPSASGSIPTIITLSATGITSIGATLNASINPNGLATQVWFTACAVPTDPAFFPNTSQRDAGSGTIVKTMTQALTGLKPNTNYSYQAWAKNSKGTKSGACVAFKTKPMSTQLSGFLKTLPQWLQRTLYIFGKKYFSPIIPNYYFLT